MDIKKKKRLMTAGIILCAAVFVFSGVILAREYIDQKRRAEAFERVASLVETDGENGSAANDSEQDANKAAAYNKYSKVYAQNNDFIGWITVPDTRINYPVMQSKNNPNFYLYHDFEKAYSKFGVPFMQENCDVATSDNLIMYGHHMYNGSMFTDLCKYIDEDFYRDHKYIRFDTMEGFGEYEVIAAFKTVAYSDDGFRYDRFVRAERKEDFDEYVAKCKKLSFYDTGVTAKYGDKLITLSTCEFSRQNGRMVVVAKKVNDRFETITAATITSSAQTVCR